MIETEDLSEKVYKIGNLEIPISRSSSQVIEHVCDQIRMAYIQQGKFVDNITNPFSASPVATEIHILFILVSDELEAIKKDIDEIKKRLDIQKTDNDIINALNSMSSAMKNGKT